MKKILSILLVSIFLSIIAFSEEKEIRYRKLMEVWPSGRGGDFVFMDLNNDGIYELIIADHSHWAGSMASGLWLNIYHFFKWNKSKNKYIPYHIDIDANIEQNDAEEFRKRSGLSVKPVREIKEKLSELILKYSDSSFEFPYMRESKEFISKPLYESIPDNTVKLQPPTILSDIDNDGKKEEIRLYLYVAGKGLNLKDSCEIIILDRVEYQYAGDLRKGTKLVFRNTVYTQDFPGDYRLMGVRLKDINGDGLKEIIIELMQYRYNWLVIYGLSKSTWINFKRKVNFDSIQEVSQYFEKFYEKYEQSLD